MFDQTDDQSQQSDYTKIFNDSTSSSDNTTTPVGTAPGAPAGPIFGASSDDSSDLASQSSSQASDTPQLDDSSATSAPPAKPANDDLIKIKQDALSELGPLVGHLDQTPEEKFRTTMMMIQAADDQSLVPKAFEAAKAITDDKTRAQALLDIINEINYFTQAGEK